jgi:hypothetical protein
MMYYQYAVQSARAQNRPLANNMGLRYGLLNGLYGLLQVVISCSTAAAYSGALVTLLHVNDPGAGVVPVEGVLPPAIVAVASCLVIGCVSLSISYYAARNTARLTGDVGLGQRAGVTAALVGAGIWLLLGSMGALLTGTDGAFLTVDPFSSRGYGSQLVGILFLVIVRAVILGGFSLLPAFLFATLGASAGKNQRQRRG